MVIVHRKLETSIVCEIYTNSDGSGCKFKMAFVKKPIWRRTTFWNAKCHDYQCQETESKITSKPYSYIQFESESVKRSVT